MGLIKTFTIRLLCLAIGLGPLGPGFAQPVAAGARLVAAHHQGAEMAHGHSQMAKMDCGMTHALAANHADRDGLSPKHGSNCDQEKLCKAFCLSKCFTKSSLTSGRMLVLDFAVDRLSGTHQIAPASLSIRPLLPPPRA